MVCRIFAHMDSKLLLHDSEQIKKKICDHQLLQIAQNAVYISQLAKINPHKERVLFKSLVLWDIGL